jgi:glycosyltransferase involved in cell wall biosynthesis
MPFAPPEVSVVVPVRNRRELLPALLDALDAQTYRDFEVVVVDDGSGDGSGEEAAGRRIAGRPVTVLAGPQRGAVAARQCGVTVASGRVLGFTDSDCRPEPKWIESAVRAIDGGADVVHGTTRPERPLRPLERSIWSDEEGLFPTCNIFYRRDLFLDLGGFDAAAGQRWGFRPVARARGLGFGEDTLLAWRAQQAGNTIEFVPEVRVDHHVFPPDLVESVSRCWMMAAFPALVHEVPELRRTLVHHRVLWGPRSRLPVYATGAALATRRRWAIAGSVSWWAVVRLTDLRRQPATWPGRLRALPEEMVLDAVTAAALVVGSVRARTLLL